MQQERYVSTTKMVVCVMWSMVAVLLLTAWVLAFAGEAQWTWVALLAFTACALSPAAAVAHIKIYTLRVTGLIRITAGIQLDDPRSESGLQVVR